MASTLPSLATLPRRFLLSIFVVLRFILGYELNPPGWGTHGWVMMTYGYPVGILTTHWLARTLFWHLQPLNGGGKAGWMVEKTTHGYPWVGCFTQLLYNSKVSLSLLPPSLISLATSLLFNLHRFISKANTCGTILLLGPRSLQYVSATLQKEDATPLPISRGSLGPSLYL
jgi:hypothetical protein